MSGFRLILAHPEAAARDAWRAAFQPLPDVEVFQGPFEEVPRFDCMVSAANSFGLMDGGVDLAIARFFGGELVRRVQARIVDEYLGEQPVGTAFVVETGHAAHPYLVHAPTMRVPMPISRTDNVYQATWAALLAVRVHNRVSKRVIRSVVFPAMGAGTGRMPFPEVARQMALANAFFLQPPAAVSWPLAEARQSALRRGGDFGQLMVPRRSEV